MDKRLDFTGINPDIRLDQILIDANANRPAMFAMLKSFAVGANQNYIVSGCVVTVGGTIPTNTWSLTAGYIYLNSELIQVEAQSGTFNSSTQYLNFAKSITYNTNGDITYNDGVTRQTWQQNRGVINVKSSVLSIELDAINGDHLDDKIKTYVGEASVLNKGLVEKATTVERDNGDADKYIDAALLKPTLDALAQITQDKDTLTISSGDVTIDSTAYARLCKSTYIASLQAKFIISTGGVSAPVFTFNQAVASAIYNSEVILWDSQNGFTVCRVTGLTPLAITLDAGFSAGTKTIMINTSICL